MCTVRALESTRAPLCVSYFIFAIFPLSFNLKRMLTEGKEN